MLLFLFPVIALTEYYACILGISVAMTVNLPVCGVTLDFRILCQSVGKKCRVSHRGTEGV